MLKVECGREVGERGEDGFLRRGKIFWGVGLTRGVDWLFFPLFLIRPR